MMKHIPSFRIGITGLCVALAAGELWAADCRWTGAAGDGRFETAGNWSTAPTSGAGDTVVFEDATGTISLPTDGFDLAAIRFLGTTSPGPTLAGGELTISGTGTVWSNQVAVTIGAPLHLTRGGTFRIENAWTQNGRVTVDSGTFYLLGRLGSDSTTRCVNFNERVEAPQADIVTGCGNWYTSASAVYFNKPISVKGFYSSGNNSYRAYLPCYTHFAATGNVWQTFSLVYAFGFANAANAVDPSTVLQIGGYYVESPTSSPGKDYPTFNLNGYDQVIDHIECAYTAEQKLNGGHVNSSSAATLTCRSTASSSVHLTVDGNVSFVWDPVSDNLVQTFSHRENATKGSLIVRGGTFRMTEGATFAQVPEIAVGEGAAFEMLSSASGALGGLTRLSVAKDGRFTVGSDAVSPFGSLAFVGLGSGAKLALPSGITLKTYALVKPDGTVVTSGTYTGETGSDSYTQVDWIDGAGVVDVSAAAPTDANYWLGGNGSWKIASNWSKGTVPAESETTVVRAFGKAATVTVDDARALPKNLTIQGAEGATATVSLAARVTSGKDHLLSVLENGVLSIPSGGVWYYDCVGGAKGSTTTGVKVSGGTLVTDGGTAILTNFYGKVTVGGNMHAPSALAVKSGTFYFRQAELSDDTILVNENGTVSLTGGLMHLPSIAWNTYVLVLNGGSVELENTAELRLGNTRTMAFGAWNEGSGRINVGDSAKLTTEDNTYQMITYATGKHPFSLVLRDQAQWAWGGSRGSSAMQFYAVDDDTRFHLDFGSSAVHQLGGNVQFPYNRGSAQCDISDGLVQIGIVRFAIGSPAGNHCATGVVNVSGGALSVNGKHCDWAEAKYYDHFCGTIVGCGVGVATNSSNFAYGALNVSGGAVTNESFVVVGAGLAEGDIVQTGGEMVGTSTSRPLIIGAAGGVGSYAITNGVSTYASDAYVGGAPFDILNLKESSVYDRFNHNAVGTLAVGSAGSFETKKTLYVGADGAGTLAVGGTGAVKAKALTVQGVRPSTLRFAFGSDGITPIKVTNAATIAANTTIDVDVSDFAGERPVRTPLIEAGTLSVDLTKVTVHFTDRTGHRASEARLIVRDQTLYANWPRGFLLIFR